MSELRENEIRVPSRRYPVVYVAAHALDRWKQRAMPKRTHTNALRGLEAAARNGQVQPDRPGFLGPVGPGDRAVTIAYLIFVFRERRYAFPVRIQRDGRPALVTCLSELPKAPPVPRAPRRAA